MIVTGWRCHIKFTSVAAYEDNVLIIAAADVTFSASKDVIVSAVAFQQVVGDYHSRPVRVFTERVGEGELKPDTTYEIGGYYASQKKITEVKSGGKC